MPEAQKRGNVFQFLLLFIALYIGMQILFGAFFPQQNEAQKNTPGPRLTPMQITSTKGTARAYPRTKITLGNHPLIQIENVPATSESHGIGGWIQSKFCGIQLLFTGNPKPQDCAALAATYTGQPLVLKDRCPKPPLDIFTVENPNESLERVTPITSIDNAIPCEAAETIAPGQTATISLAPWKYSLFEKVGTYEVRVPDTLGIAKTESGLVVPLTLTRFEIVEPGVFTKAFRTFISAPFLNFLIFIASWTPGHNLGIAIILLTLTVKILLFFPTQHALEGQKKMQMLQPKLEALKTKYHGDAKKIQEETMKLWAEHKINPFQSCLPMVIQFPVLIGLFYIIRDGSNLALSHHLIYGVYQNLPWHFGTNFLGLDLLKPNVTVMPLLLVAMQFLQMKLTFSIQKSKKSSRMSLMSLQTAKQKKNNRHRPRTCSRT